MFQEMEQNKVVRKEEPSAKKVKSVSNVVDGRGGALDVFWFPKSCTLSIPKMCSQLMLKFVLVAALVKSHQVRGLKFVFTFLVKQPSQLKYLEWHSFQSTHCSLLHYHQVYLCKDDTSYDGNVFINTQSVYSQF
ncbi:hypothetical protein Q3G72_011663 [Acer saccharum]|nr:hypothetical protein Q3G72_011663 [Acer saccharum]